MAVPRRTQESRIVNKDGNALNITLLDALLPDDLVIQGMKAEGYRVMTGRDVAPEYDRRILDYLIRLRTVTF